MFRAMRRTKKQLTEAEAVEILNSGQEGVLATVGTDQYPYAVPLNYAYFDGCIYFHCAPVGQKLDNIQSNPKVSFCVIQDSEILPAEFSTRFRSVVAFGTAEMVTDSAKAAGLLALVHKYSSDHLEAGEKYIQAAAHKTAVVRIRIEHLSGKGA